MRACVNCGGPLTERDPGEWYDDMDLWECSNPPDPDTDCHVPTEPGVEVLPFEVEFTVIVHVRATDAEKAYEVAEPHAMRAGRQGEWNNYDDCTRQIEPDQF